LEILYQEPNGGPGATAGTKEKLVSGTLGQWVVGQVHLTWDMGRLTFDS